MTTQYRLLNVGEVVQEGDEYWSVMEQWVPATPGIAVAVAEKHRHCRRPLAPTGWIAIKDRKPEFPCVVGFFNGSGEWVSVVVTHDANVATHWAPLPPPPVSEDDAAFQAWKKADCDSFEHLGGEDILKRAYFAGLAKGRGGK